MQSTLVAIETVRQAGARFGTAFADATDAEWAHRSGPGAWSVGDIVEHTTIATGNVLRRMQAIGKHPLAGATHDVNDDEIPYLFYRGDEPTGVATPTGLMQADRAAAIAFSNGIAAIVNWAQGCELDLRAFGAPHPMFGTLDGMQWLLFCGAHTERHRAQIIGELHRQRQHAVTSA